MLDNDDVMTSSVSEVTQKIPRDKKSLSQMLLVCYSFHLATEKRYSVVKRLDAIRHIQHS